MNPQTQESTEPASREAQCPNCGLGFQTYRPRPTSTRRTPVLLAPAVCPRCGCHNCIIK